MPKYKIIPTPKSEFTEEDMHFALSTLGIKQRMGEISGKDIAGITDLVGLSRGVNFEGRQQAKIAIKTMLLPNTAREIIAEGVANIEIPQIVENFDSRIAEIGAIAATNEIIDQFNQNG